MRGGKARDPSERIKEMIRVVPVSPVVCDILSISLGSDVALIYSHRMSSWHLVKKKVIRPGVELECFNCLLTEWYSLSVLSVYRSFVTCRESLQVIG